MSVLLDTELLLWAAGVPDRLSAKAKEIILDSSVELTFSAVSIWEVSVKSTLGRTDFQVFAWQLYECLAERGYAELSIRSEHTLASMRLPLLHKDPFDRLLVAQANTESVTLITTDESVAQYSEKIRLV